jgi:hypothetical protein
MIPRIALATALAFAAFGAVLMVDEPPIELVQVESRAAHLAAVATAAPAPGMRVVVHLASENSCATVEAPGAPSEARMSKLPPPRQDI